MHFRIESVKTNFLNDYKSKKLKSTDLVKKYSFKNRQDLYQTISDLRKEGLLPESKLSTAIKSYYKNKKDIKPTTTANISTKDRTAPIVDYRTVYFKDFTVQIHKKSMARLVVDQHANLHILN